MKDVLKWLETRFYRQSANAEPDEPDIPVAVGATRKNDDRKASTVDVLTLDKNVDQEAVTDPRLKILRDSPPDASESIGVDPYNTGRFNTS